MTRVLLTGGYGCIGSETAKWLLDNTDATVVICSRHVSPARTERVFFNVDRARLVAMEVDVCNGDQLELLLKAQRITHVVHMAALQTPDCNAHRDLGLQINLAGTQKLIEAMKASGLPIQRYIFASSIAVYGPRALYPVGSVPRLAQPQPVNVYGVWKLAGEQITKFYCEDSGVPSLSIRPGVLFGPGRDAGLTSSPTTAIKCVALGLPYKIPFCSRQDYQYAPDVGAAVGQALLDPFDGYGVFTLPSHTLATADIVHSLQLVADELGLANQFAVTIGEHEVPFICDLEYSAFQEAFPNTPHTSLNSALRQSLQTFREQVQRGWLTEQNVFN